MVVKEFLNNSNINNNMSINYNKQLNKKTPKENNDNNIKL